MKRGYTLLELIIVLAIILVLMLPTLNISKSYIKSIEKIKGKSIVNDISNLISYSKYYCRQNNSQGLIEISRSKGKIVFKDTSGRSKTIKTIILEDGFKFVSNDSLSINKIGSVESATIRIMNEKGDLYKVTIATGVDTVNIYEGE